MSTLRFIRDHPFTFWVLLSLPAIPIIFSLASGDAKAVSHALHPTGEFAARYLIVTMMITPLTMLFRNAGFPRWLMKRRRYLGVGAFFFGLAHTVLYLVDEGAVAFTAGELSKLYIWAGWLAFLIFVPLAITSTDGWVRRLGPRWKTLQRFVYGAAVLTLIHWAALHDWGGIGPAMVQFTPLVLLELYRFWSRWQRRYKRAAA